MRSVIKRIKLQINMRVLFASAIVAALVNASGAPAPSGNTAKRNVDQHLAPHRYDQTKILIASDQADQNMGGGELKLQVVLKADNDNRKQQEIHTTLTLSGVEIAEGEEINMGWAMMLTNASDIVIGDDKGFKPDSQGSTEDDLSERARRFSGERGWDGMNAYQVKSGDGKNWASEESWNLLSGTRADVPNVYAEGIAALGVEAENNFIVYNEYSELPCLAEAGSDDPACSATVYSERVWDSQSTAGGYVIEEKNELMYDFIGWYYVVKPACESAPARMLPDDENATGDDADTTDNGDAAAGDAAASGHLVGCADLAQVTVKGQSMEPQVYVLGALSGLAAVSTAILAAMIF